MEYLKESELKEEISKSKITGVPTEKLKMSFVILIDNLLESGNFRNYDEETKDIMRVKAYEFLTLYWKNYAEKKYIFYIEEDREFLKKYLRVNPKKFRVITESGKKITKLGVVEEAEEVERKLKKKNISYKKEVIFPKAFAYLSQIAKNAFLQTIKKSKFKHIVKTDNNNELNIIDVNRDNSKKEYFKHGESPSSELIKANASNYDNVEISKSDEVVERIMKTYKRIKKNCEKSFKDGCIKVETICDLHPAIKAALMESENFEEFIAVVNFFYEEKELTLKDVISNPTIYFILKKMSEE